MNREVAFSQVRACSVLKLDHQTTLSPFVRLQESSLSCPKSKIISLLMRACYKDDVREEEDGGRGEYRSGQNSEGKIYKVQATGK
ncbi:hypothetical protein QQP08_008063 [Theobroma cacao]|nr:hypothetical protein QQP08_008063 [Theobroma cacao]